MGGGGCDVLVEGEICNTRGWDNVLVWAISNSLVGEWDIALVGDDILYY